MNIAQIRKYDIGNGPGVRTTLFVSGCTHNCKNCFNKEYQNFQYGQGYTAAVEDLVITYASDKNVQGINILGGEPLQQTKDTDLENLLSKLSTIRKPIWLWTGYTFEEILALPTFASIEGILQYVDVLIDGRFVEEKKDLTLKYRGSSNQRILDCKESMKCHKPVSIDIS